MQALNKIYESLDEPSTSARLPSHFESQADFTPWNSLNLKSSAKKKSKILIHGIDNFLKSSRVKSHSQQATPSKKK